MAPPFLPSQPTPFIGRENELREIAELLSNPGCRLLTLVGPGGIGKTRLALQTVNQNADNFPERAYFVSLVPAASPDLIVPTIIESLNISAYGDLKVSLFDHLNENQTLLVLDNFEHVLAGAELLTEMLTAAPRLKLMVTSRERLYLQQEWIFDVRGLNLSLENSSGALERSDALELFLQSAHRAGVIVTEADQSAALRICQMVEGMPLAIELAAAWTRTLSCRQIAAEMERSLDILTTPLRDVPEKHRSMRAAFEHSWRLLSEEEKSAFRRLSVFSKNFTRQAAEQVTGASLWTLASLVEKSLLHTTEAGRFELHELLRQYAEEKLNEQPGEAEQAREQHSAYYSELMFHLGEALKGADQAQALDEIDLELSNVRLAWKQAVARRNERYIQPTLDGLALFFEMRTRDREGAEMFELAVKTFGGEESRLAGQLFMLQGWFTSVDDDSKAIALIRKGMSLLCRLGLQGMTGMLFYKFAMSTGEDVGIVQQVFDDGLTLFRQENDRWRTAWALFGRGVLAEAQGQVELGLSFHRESLQIFQALGDGFGSIFACSFLEKSAERSAMYGEARRLYEQNLAINYGMKNTGGIIYYLIKLTLLSDALNDHENFERFCDETLRAIVSLGVSRQIVNYEIYGIARRLEIEGQLPLAVEAFTFCIDCGDLSQYQPLIWKQVTNALERLEKQLPTEVFSTAVQRARGDNTRLFFTNLLHQRASAIEDQKRGNPMTAAYGRTEPLNQRELEILTCTAEGLSSRETAERLFLSVGTIRWYLKQIYEKLGVHSRTQAIARARELNLLA